MLGAPEPELAGPDSVSARWTVEAGQLAGPAMRSVPDAGKGTVGWVEVINPTRYMRGPLRCASGVRAHRAPGAMRAGRSATSVAPRRERKINSLIEDHELTTPE